MIVLENISKSFGEKVLFHDLNMTLQKGDSVTIMGASGCGKTTLLRIMAGLEIPDWGTVKIDDITVTKDGSILVEPFFRKIGFVFQDLALWPHMTVEENILYGLRSSIKDRGLIRTKLNDILEYFRIQDHREKSPHLLSRGEQQRVALARTLVVDPPILLLDEPVSNLDEDLKKEFFSLIRKYRQEHPVIIIHVTHIRAEGEEITDRFLYLKNGVMNGENK